VGRGRRVGARRVLRRGAGPEGGGGGGGQRARAPSGPGRDRRPYALILSHSGRGAASGFGAGAWQSRVMVDDRDGLSPPSAPMPLPRRRRPPLTLRAAGPTLPAVVLPGRPLPRPPP